MGWFAEAFGPWYGVVYPHRDDAEARRLASTLAAWRDLAGRRHLDVGAGAARHLDALAELGVRSVGLDYSEHLLAEARRRAAPGAPWRLVRGDMRHLPFGDEAFDLVTSLFTSFGYFGPEEDGRVLAEASRVLGPGGIHVLDFLNRDRTLEHLKPETSRTSGDYRVEERRRVERGAVVKEVVVRPRTGGAALASYEERVMLYDRAELDRRLAAVGLRPRRWLGEYDGTAFDPRTSTRLIVLSEKESA